MTLLLLIAAGAGAPVATVHVARPGIGAVLHCGLLAARPRGCPPDGPGLLADDAGRPVPVVAHRHRGGWLLHGVVAGPVGRDLVLRTAAPGARGDVRPLVVSQGATVVTVEDDGRRFALGPDGVVRSGDLSLSPWPPPLPGGRWEVRHACPLRVDAVFTGTCGAAGRIAADLRWAVTVHAGSPVVDAGVALFAPEPTRWPEGCGWRVRSDGGLELPGLAATTLPASGARVAGGFRFGPRTLVPPGRHRLLFRGTVPLRVLAPAGRGHRVERLVLEPDGRGARLLLEAAAPALARGEGRVHRARFSLGGGAPAGPALVVPAQPVRRAGGGTRVTTERAPRALARSARVLGRVFVHDARRGLDPDGPHAGDYLMSRSEVGNLEYDAALGLVLHALREGDPHAFSAALAARDHLLGRARDRTGSGLFFPHGPGHRGTPVEAGHHWVSGLLLLEHAAPDALLSPEVAATLEDQQRTLGGLDLDRQLPRSLGWGLLALASGARWQGAARDARRAVRAWRRHVLARQTRSGLLGLVRFRGNARVHLVDPVVQGGIVAPALVRSLLVVPSARDRGRTAALARALVANAVVREDGGVRLASRLVAAASEERATPVPGAARAPRVALFLAGVVTADPAARRRGDVQALRRFVARALDASSRFVGNDAALVLRSLPALSGW